MAAGIESLPLRFFFYGTLIAGSDNAAARVVHSQLRRIGAASVPGALWAIPDAAGWYPALVTGPGRVSGVLYQAIAGFGSEDLARLDEWEDFRADKPESSLYSREVTAVTDAAGVSFSAQVYWFNQPLPFGAQAIADGDFPAWLQIGQKAEFRG